MKDKYQEALDKLYEGYKNGMAGRHYYDILKELVDEKKPMKVKSIIIEHYGLRETRVGCPKCNTELAYTINSKSARKYKYCPECGTRIIWESDSND